MCRFCTRSRLQSNRETTSKQKTPNQTKTSNRQHQKHQRGSNLLRNSQGHEGIVKRRNRVIREGAWRNCQHLQIVHLDSAVISLQTRVFCRCHALRNLFLHESRRCVCRFCASHLVRVKKELPNRLHPNRERQAPKNKQTPPKQTKRRSNLFRNSRGQ